MTQSLYLDNAATTPVRREVLEAMMPYLTGIYGNPSSHHTVGEHAAHALAGARARVAAVLGMRQSDIIFTSGGTEANNLAVKGISISAHLGRQARHLITSSIEHESILRSADYLARVHGFEITRVDVDRLGVIDPGAIAGAMRPDTALVSIGQANNEVGTVQDVTAIAAALRDHRTPLHVDAVQSAGWLPLADLAASGVDAITLAGHKLGTPKGIGVLAIRGRIAIEPLLHGGGQERGKRSGTEDVAGAIGIATALELADAQRSDTFARVSRMRDEFIDRVLRLVPSAALTGDPVNRLPGTASFTFAGTSGEAVLLELERRGIVSSSGSACAAGSDDPSHVLLAMGFEPEVAQTAVRITFPHDTASVHRAFDADAASLADSLAASVAAVGSTA